MRISIIADIAKMEYQISKNITETKQHLEQTTEYNVNREELAKLKNNIKKEKLQNNIEKLQTLIIDLPNNNIRLNEISLEKGASTWLLTQSLKEDGQNLSKHLHRSLSCKKIAANLTDQVCHNVRIEFRPQNLTDETFDSRSMNVRDEDGWTLVPEGFERNNK